MAAYMKEYDMEWPALEFDKRASAKEVMGYGGKGIPRLVFVDAAGKVLSDSYEGDKYVGPSKVLEDIEKKLKSEGGSTARAGAGSSSFDSFFKKKPAGE
jgi:nucleoredoxin